MTFSNLAKSIDVLRPYVENDHCLIATPDTLHIRIATPSPTDAAALQGLGWQPSPVHRGEWNFSTIGEE